MALASMMGMHPLLVLEANEEARFMLLLLRASSSIGYRVCITVSKSGLYTCEIARQNQGLLHYGALKLLKSATHFRG